MTDVGNVQAVVLSNTKPIQDPPRIHRQAHLAGSRLVSFPLATIMLQYRWVNGKLIRHWL